MTKLKIRPEKNYSHPESGDIKKGQVWINKANKWNCSKGERLAFLNNLVEVKRAEVKI